MKEVCERYNLDYSLFYDLGSFEKEYNGRGVRAKFLGAKRYIIEQDGEYHTTIAGLPKKALAGYVAGRKIQWEIYRYGEYPDTFSIFTDKMLLSADVSLKNAHTYNDEPHAGTINGVGVFELSSVGIYPIDFTMKLAPYYMTLITMLNERPPALCSLKLSCPLSGFSSPWTWQPFLATEDERAVIKRIHDFPGGPGVKNPPANAGDTGSIPGPGRIHV